MECQIPGCAVSIRSDHVFCYKHYQEYLNGFIHDLTAGGMECQFWDCTISIRPNHVFCYKHYQQFLDGFIDGCPGCHKPKHRWYKVCFRCRQSPNKRRSTHETAPDKEYSRYEQEYSPIWKHGDAESDEFFVYILKLDGGKFYTGQTRELRERLSEHRDGKTPTTKGRGPKLVWFTTVNTREEAVKLEKDIKKLASSNQRQIRRMIVRFEDLVRELDFEAHSITTLRWTQLVGQNQCGVR